MTYLRRAESRADGWAEFQDHTRPAVERQAGLTKVIQADYERSLEAWKGARKRRPHGDWPCYVASWLFTHAANLSEESDRELMDVLRAEFPPGAPRLWRGYYWSGRPVSQGIAPCRGAPSCGCVTRHAAPVPSDSSRKKSARSRSLTRHCQPY
jgi:hypothetical protein